MISDLFMKQVKKNSDWYLIKTMKQKDWMICMTRFGTYWKYVEEGKYREKISAHIV